MCVVVVVGGVPARERTARGLGRDRSTLCLLTTVGSLKARVAQHVDPSHSLMNDSRWDESQLGIIYHSFLFFRFFIFLFFWFF